MAKPMVSTLALIAMVGLIDATSPLLGGLAGGGAQGQTQGFLGSTGGLGAEGLLSGVIHQLVNTLVRPAVLREIDNVAERSTNAAALAANDAASRGATREEAYTLAYVAALQAIRPSDEAVAHIAANAGVERAYQRSIQEPHPGLTGGLGRK